MTSALDPVWWSAGRSGADGSGYAVVAFGELAAHVFASFPPRRPATDTLRLGEVHLTLGGGTALVCQQFARLGHRVAMEAMAGSDDIGNWLIAEARSHGIDCQTPLRSGKRTGRTLVLHDRSGNHDILHELSDGTPGMLAARVPTLWPSNVTFAYCPGFPGFEPVLEALVRASAPTVVDLGFRPWLEEPAGYREAVLGRAPFCRVCLLSGDGLSHDQQASLMRESARLGPHLIVMTLGAGGSLILAEDGEIVHSPAVPCSPVNTLGAGDAFAAGLLVGLVEGLTPREALKLGNATAAAVISAFPVLPGRDEVGGRRSGE